MDVDSQSSDTGLICVSGFQGARTPALTFPGWWWWWCSILIIYLDALGLSCGMWDLSAATCGILAGARGI